MNLQETATKLKINLLKSFEVTLSHGPYASVEDWHRILDDFVKMYGTKNATIEIDDSWRRGSEIERIYISACIPKTDEELNLEIEETQKNNAEAKDKKKQQEKKALESKEMQDRLEYERLKVKFG